MHKARSAWVAVTGRAWVPCAAAGSAVLSSLVGFAGVMSLAACGGSNAPSAAATSAAVGAAGPATGASVTVSVGDAGATSTTTQTLVAAGGATGTKLTPLASTDGGASAARPKHVVELGRSVTDIQAIVASHRDEARACYDIALAGHPGIEGNLDVKWTIDPTGAVSEAEIDSSRSDILEPSVGTCIVAIVKKIRFNASAKGFETKANYPFNFHPRPHGAGSGQAPPQH